MSQYDQYISKLVSMGYSYTEMVTGLLSILTKDNIRVHLTRDGYKIFISGEEKCRVWSKTNGDLYGSKLFEHIKLISRSNTINKIIKLKHTL